MRWIAAVVIVAGGLWAAPAQAAQVFSIHGAQTTGLLGGCGSDGPTCTYIIASWTPQAGTFGADSLPFQISGVLTHFRAPFYAAGTVRLQVVSEHLGMQPPGYTVLASGPRMAAPAGGLIDTPVRLPVRPGATLALGLEGGAGPYLVYEEGGSGPGAGELLFAYGESDTDLENVDFNGVDNGIEAFSAVATVEPDADGDGFGDETQDRCPGVAGPADGCVAPPAAPGPPAAPAQPVARHRTPAFLRAHRHGRTVTYTLRGRASVRARLERRRGGHWRVVRSRRLPGSRGTHRFRVRRHIGRVVLRAGKHRVVLGR
jgi:hypothetical protein